MHFNNYNCRYTSTLKNLNWQNLLYLVIFEHISSLIVVFQ